MPPAHSYADIPSPFTAAHCFSRYARDVKFVEGSSTKIRMCRVSGYFVAMTEATAEVLPMPMPSCTPFGLCTHLQQHTLSSPHTLLRATHPG